MQVITQNKHDKQIQCVAVHLTHPSAGTYAFGSSRGPVLYERLVLVVSYLLFEIVQVKKIQDSWINFAQSLVSDDELTYSLSNQNSKSCPDNFSLEASRYYLETGWPTPLGADLKYHQAGLLQHAIRLRAKEIRTGVIIPFSDLPISIRHLFTSLGVNKTTRRNSSVLSCGLSAHSKMWWNSELSL